MKQLYALKKRFWNLTKFLLFFFFLSIFSSCGNLFENTISDSSDLEEEELNVNNTVNFYGNLNVSGAVPSQISRVTGRSALPSVPTDAGQYEYYITATSGSLVHEVKKAPGTDLSYILSLELGRTWTFKAGFRKKASGISGESDYVAAKDLMVDSATKAGHPFSCSLSESSFEVPPHNFMLQPFQSGKGRIDISFSVESSLAGSDVTLDVCKTGSDGRPVEWLSDITPDGNTYNIKSSENPADYTINSGSYELVFTFRKKFIIDGQEFVIPVYDAYHTFNVFDDMTTSMWEEGNYSITNAMVEAYFDSTIYVGTPAGLSVTADDNNAGTPFSPLENLSTAIK